MSGVFTHDAVVVAVASRDGAFSYNNVKTSGLSDKVHLELTTIGGGVHAGAVSVLGTIEADSLVGTTLVDPDLAAVINVKVDNYPYILIKNGNTGKSYSVVLTEVINEVT